MSKYIATLDVKAIQYTDESSIKTISKVYPFCSYDEDFKVLVVHTHRGVLCMNKGDYIVEVFDIPIIVSTDIFEMRFKPV